MREAKKPELKNRKGAFAIMFALFFLVLVATAAMATDFSRLWTFRNELQTAADAGALAGAIQLNPPRNGATATDSANAYITANKTLTRTPIVDSIQLGNWNLATAHFTPGLAPINAIHVVAKYPSAGLLSSVLGIVPPMVKARATAWATAPVGSNNCMMPFALPYKLLMYRLFQYRYPGQTPPNDSLVRPFTQDDLNTLNSMPATAREFQLKLGTGGAADTGSAPGNYYAVQLPKYWDYATQSTTGWNPDAGANAYKENIAGVRCHQLAVGDSLNTQTGIMVGPTIDGFGGYQGNPGRCAYYNNSSGICRQADQVTEVEGPAAFFVCTVACSGNSKVEVSLLGSFTVLEIGGQGGQYNGPLDAAEIRGRFNPIQTTGPVTTSSSTLYKIVLVR